MSQLETGVRGDLQPSQPHGNTPNSWVCTFVSLAPPTISVFFFLPQFFIWDQLAVNECSIIWTSCLPILVQSAVPADHWVIQHASRGSKFLKICLKSALSLPWRSTVTTLALQIGLNVDLSFEGHIKSLCKVCGMQLLAVKALLHSKPQASKRTSNKLWVVAPNLG